MYTYITIYLILQKEEELLSQCLDKIDVSDPFYMHVAMTVHQLNRNPFWRFDQKVKYVEKLIRGLQATETEQQVQQWQVAKFALDL